MAGNLLAGHPSTRPHSAASVSGGPGLGGRLVLPFSLWLMKRTMLGNPLIKPWEDLARFSDKLTMEEFMFGSWYICSATKS